jgi:hypothetical protein
MSPSELADLFENHPNTPFRLTLSSGDVVDVDNPSRTIFQSLALYIGQSDDPESRFAKRVRVVSVPNIALVEPMERRPRGRRRRS